jgi:glycerate dehydrogenase
MQGQRPRIVVLDGYSLNPGDLSWEPLAALGELTVHDRTPPDAILARAAGAPVILTNKTVVGEAVIRELPDLRYIGVLATGTNVVDRAAAHERGVIVTNVPDYGADSVAEHALSLMLEGVKHLSAHLGAVRDGGWSRQSDFSFTVAPIRLLAGKTLGIVGFGAIGKRVAQLAVAFKMNVVLARHGTATLPPGVAYAELDEVFARADVLTLHCPLTSTTERMVNRARLSLMKPTALFINTSRGGLVDEAALADALREKRIAGAYLDVLGAEPPAADHPLVALPNAGVTAHIAWASVEARSRLLEIAIDNVRAFLAGTPQNSVG